MRSSISTFDGRPWHIYAVAAFVLGVTMLTGWNELAFSRGFIPTIEDDLPLWQLSWDRVQQPDPSMTAFIGSSRIQYALSPQIWQEMTGKPAVQLGIVGSNSVFMLDELARLDSFRGLVIGDLFAPPFSYPDFGGHGREIVTFVKEYDRRSVVALFERRLRLSCEQRFAFWNESFAIDRVIRQVLASGHVPEFELYSKLSNMTITMADRFKYFRALADDHGSSSDGPARPPLGIGFNWNGVHPDAAILDANLQRVHDSIHSIQSRGGRVVILRMPMTGIHSDLELKGGNGDDIWRRVARESGATILDTTSAPALFSGLSPVDGVHLAGDDAIEFTRRLAVLLPTLVPALQASP